MVSSKVDIVEEEEAEAGETAFTTANPLTTLKFTSGSKDEEILEVRVNIIIAETDVKTLTVRETTKIVTIDRRERPIMMKKAI